MDVKIAQEDMRTAYLWGGPGVFISGLVWIFAGTLTALTSLEKGILGLFIGGMFIHPVGGLLTKLLKGSDKHRADNPLVPLALESLVLLFIAFFLAFSLKSRMAELFFPLVLMLVGGRYFFFATLYGTRIFWGLGGSLVAIGCAAFLFPISSTAVGIGGGLVEVVFALGLTALAKKSVS